MPVVDDTQVVPVVDDTVVVRSISQNLQLQLLNFLVEVFKTKRCVNHHGLFLTQSQFMSAWL